MSNPQPKIIRKPIDRTTGTILGISSIAALVAFYFALSYRQHQINPTDTLMPGVSQLWDGLKILVSPDRHGDRWILSDSWASGKRLFFGTSLGVFASVALGIAMGCFRVIEKICLWPLSFLAKIPPTAMMALFFILFGTQEWFFVSMITFGIFPTLTQAIFRITREDVPMNYIYKGYTLGASMCELIFSITFPKILPAIIESARLAVGPALIYLIAAEWATASEGWGYRLRMQSRLMNMNVVFIYLFLLGFLGLFLDRFFALTRKKLCPWFGE